MAHYHLSVVFENSDELYQTPNKSYRPMFAFGFQITTSFVWKFEWCFKGD
ncbi:hypothetical protein HanIR_Chr14g0717511 [Helianthus annuus]|nr:hypothetical protein HanIR_Chr14g0717511 [Helianthus annuus]